MITPINGHILIEPLRFKTFLPSERQTFEEIGTVKIKGMSWWRWLLIGEFRRINVEDRVYFDSWLAARYPKPNAENDDDFYWLVPFKDIRAVEKKEE